MPTPRFFIDAPTDAFQLGGRFELPPKTARHAGRSLRLAAGEIVELFNGTGAAWSGPVGFSDASAWVELEHRTDRTAESPLAITLLQSLVAPEKADWIVEKAVEAGISEIIFMPAERSVTKLAGERLEKRLARLTDIARSAAEQCGRNVVPLVRQSPLLKPALRLFLETSNLFWRPVPMPLRLRACCRDSSPSPLPSDPRAGSLLAKSSSPPLTAGGLSFWGRVFCARKPQDWPRLFGLRHLSVIFLVPAEAHQEKRAPHSAADTLFFVSISADKSLAFSTAAFS